MRQKSEENECGARKPTTTKAKANQTKRDPSQRATSPRDVNRSAARDCIARLCVILSDDLLAGIHRTAGKKPGFRPEWEVIIPHRPARLPAGLFARNQVNWLIKIAFYDLS